MIIVCRALGCLLLALALSAQSYADVRSPCEMHGHSMGDDMTMTMLDHDMPTDDCCGNGCECPKAIFLSALLPAFSAISFQQPTSEKVSSAY